MMPRHPQPWPRPDDPGCGPAGVGRPGARRLLVIAALWHAAVILVFWWWLA